MIELLKKIQKAFDTQLVYQAGGSLAPHLVHDYDIVVLNDWSHSEIFQELEYLYRQGKMFQEINVYKAYNLGDEENGMFHTKAVCEMDGVKIDLLFADTTDYPTIYHVMNDFPLSIQMQAMGTDGRIIQGKNFCLDPIVIYRNGCVKSCIEKYRGYYPSTKFFDDKLKTFV